jgi:hypothetical protein
MPLPPPPLLLPRWLEACQLEASSRHAPAAGPWQGRPGAVLKRMRSLPRPAAPRPAPQKYRLSLKRQAAVPASAAGSGDTGPRQEAAGGAAKKQARGKQSRKEEEG